MRQLLHIASGGRSRVWSALVGWHVDLEWKVQDLWIGAFWRRIGNAVDVYVCLIPCVPLHVSWWWTREPAEPIRVVEDIRREVTPRIRAHRRGH